MTTETQCIHQNFEFTEPSEKSIYKVGAAVAAVEIAIILIQAPIFMLYPQPTTVMGHFTQFQSNKLLGLVDLDLMLILGEVFAIPIILALYFALRRAAPSLMTMALALGLGGIGLFLAVNPTFSMLYLSDQYAMATLEAQRLALLAAGEALWANYNGTAFDLFFVFIGIAYLIMGAVMLRSRIFNKATAYVGMVMGLMLLVPGSASLGTVGVVFSTGAILPSLVWNVLIARRFWQMGRECRQKA